MTAGARVPFTRRAWWPWARRAAALLFFLGVGALLLHQARNIDWGEVRGAISHLPLHTLLAAGALAACSHALYSTYDLLGRHLTGHKLGTPTVMGVTFISYAFNLNLGSMVGGVAFRLRLYSRLGLANEKIARILGFSLLTNWTGYLVAVGLAFSFWPPDLPPQWEIREIDSRALRLLGACALASAAGYVLLCAWAHGRSWTVRGHRLQPPSPRMALLQLAMSCSNWCLIGGVVWVLLQGRVDYGHVLAVLLSAALAGLVLRVPAGLGVLEAVFLAVLSHRVPQGELLAALLAYRGIYYLLPLLLAAVAYAITEVRVRHLRAPVRRLARKAWRYCCSAAK